MLEPKNFRRNQSEVARGLGAAADHYKVIGGADGDNEDEWEFHTVAYHADGDFTGILLEELPIKGTGIPSIIIARRVGLTDTELGEIPLSSLPPLNFFSVDYFGTGFEATGRVFFAESAVGWTVVVKRYAGMGRVPRSPQKNGFVWDALTAESILGPVAGYAGGLASRESLAWKELEVEFDSIIGEVGGNDVSNYGFERFAHGIANGASRIIKAAWHYLDIFSSPNKIRGYDTTDPEGKEIRFSDGSRWANVLMPDGQWSDFAERTDGRIVAVGVNAVSLFVYDITYSDDGGFTWIGVVSPQDATSWRSVAYGNGYFVAVSSDGSQRIMNSADGINWAMQDSPEVNSWQEVRFLNGIHVACSTDGANRVMSSVDGGFTWVSRNNTVGGRGISYAAGNYVIVGDSGYVATSTDLDTWTTRTSPQSNSWRSVDVTRTGSLIASGSSNGTAPYAFMRSTNSGISWVSIASPESGDRTYVKIRASGSVVVAISSDNLTDGYTPQYVVYTTDPFLLSWGIGIAPAGLATRTSLFWSSVFSRFIMSGTIRDMGGAIYGGAISFSRFFDDTYIGITTGILPSGAVTPRMAKIYILYKQVAP